MRRLEEELETWLVGRLVAGVTPGWVRNQRDFGMDFVSYHEELETLADATPIHLLHWLGDLQARGNGAATLSRKATVIRAWARWAVAVGMVDTCSMAVAEVPRDPYNRPEVRPLWEYRAALQAHPPAEPWNMLFRVLLGSGLRRGELLHLHWEDVDLEAGTVEVKVRKGWSPKGRKGRIAALDADAREAMAEVMALRRRSKNRLGPCLNRDGSTVPNDSSLTHAWTRWTREQELPPRLHSTRHAHATAAANSGANLADVQRQLGHAAITTTMGYVHPDAGAALRVIEKLDRANQVSVKSRGQEKTRVTIGSCKGVKMS